MKHEGIHWLFWEQECFRKEGWKTCSVLTALCASAAAQTPSGCLQLAHPRGALGLRAGPGHREDEVYTHVLLQWLFTSALSATLISHLAVLLIYMQTIQCDLFHTLPYFLV